MNLIIQNHLNKLLNVYLFKSGMLPVPFRYENIIIHLLKSYMKTMSTNSKKQDLDRVSNSTHVRSLNKNIQDSFFILDHSASNVKLDMSYLHRPLNLENSKKYIHEKPSNSSINIPSPSSTSSTLPSSQATPIIPTNPTLLSQKNDVIYEKTCTSSYIPLIPTRTNCSSYKNIKSKQPYFEQRRNFHKKPEESTNKMSPKKCKISQASENNDDIIVIERVVTPPLIVTIDDDEDKNESISVIVNEENKNESSSVIVNEENKNESSSIIVNEENKNESSSVIVNEENKNESSSVIVNEENSPSSAEEEINSNNYEIDVGPITYSQMPTDPNEPEFIPLSDYEIKKIEPEFFISSEVMNKRYRLDSLRKWELNSNGHNFMKIKKDNQPFNFTFVSYNVLSQTLLQDNQYLYHNCDSLHLSWDYRWSLFQHEMKQLLPDIITLQEVEAAYYYTHYKPWFAHYGYKCLFKKRTYDKVDGCAIIFKADKFNLIESTSVEYRQPKSGLMLNRDNIGLIAMLTPISYYSPFCVATTHLLYNPKRHDIKLAQLAILLTELDRICYKKEEGGRTLYHPIILSGDFNAEPSNLLLHFLTRGFVQYKGLCKRTLMRVKDDGNVFENDLLPQSLGISDRCQHSVLERNRYVEKTRGSLFSLADKRKLEEGVIKLEHTGRKTTDKHNVPNQDSSASGSSVQSSRSSGIIHHNFDFTSVYQHYLPRLGNEEEVTTKHNKWVTVDYIMYSKIFSNQQGKEEPLKLLGKYGLLSHREAELFVPWPSDVCPSDHFPLAAQFSLSAQSFDK